MVRFAVAAIFCCFFSVYGSPILEKCNGAQISVIGNHYSFLKNCDSDDHLIQKLSELKNHYFMVRSNEKQIPGYFPLESLTSLVTEAVQKIVEKHVTKPLKTALVCTACKSVFNSVKYGLSTGASEEELINLVGGLLCDYFQILSVEICHDYLHIAGPPLLYILNNTAQPPEVVCSFVLAKTCVIDTPPDLDWEITIPEKKPAKAAIKRDFKENKLLNYYTSLTHTSTISLWKEVGTNAICRYVAAIHHPTTPHRDEKCDIPARTFESLLDFVVNNITDVDHVIWTGDIPAHDLWGQSQDKNLELINKTISTLKNYFKGENSVLPSLGNHEPVPGNLYYNQFNEIVWNFSLACSLPTPGITDSDATWSNDWLYETLASQWTSNWLSVNDSTIKSGAYYKTEYRPGLVVVSINSVFCYFNNWWLILDSKDPAGELAWLIETLLDAEERGDKVHIIAHVPPGGDECLKVWQRNYYRIIHRFQDTVAAQFFGHTHNDEFALILDSEDEKKTAALMLIGPSATTYTYLNPGFRIYYVDGDYENSSRRVLDYETWILDLEESNRIDSPVWKKLYSAKEAYQLNSMDPEEWRNVYERMKTDDQVLQQYHKFFWKDSPKRPVCDDACRKQYLCSIVSCNQYGDPENNNRFW